MSRINQREVNGEKKDKCSLCMLSTNGSAVVKGCFFAGSKEEKTRSELRHNFSLDEEREAIRGADGGG